MNILKEDTRCLETRTSKLLTRKDGSQVVSPFISLRNRPNHMGITFQYGKRKGQLKPYKHKDCNEI